MPHTNMTPLQQKACISLTAWTSNNSLKRREVNTTRTHQIILAKDVLMSNKLKI